MAERADKAIRAGKPFNVELQRRDDLGMLVRFTAMFRSAQNLQAPVILVSNSQALAMLYAKGLKFSCKIPSARNLMGDFQVCDSAERCRPGVSDNLDEHMPQIAIPGAMSSMKEDGVSDNLYFCTMQTVIRSAETTAGTTFR